MIMTSRPWVEYWIEHYFAYAKPISKDNPLAHGWCVYVEVHEFD